MDIKPTRREFLKESLEGIVKAISIGSILLIFGCGKSLFGPDEEVNSKTVRKDGIEYYIQTDKREYKLGETVEMLYMVTNLEEIEQQIRVYRGPGYNILIQKNGQIIWRFNQDFRMSGETINISPGETLYFLYTSATGNSIPHVGWDMKDQQGNPAGTGEYSVYGIAYTLPRTDVAVPITIRKK